MKKNTNQVSNAEEEASIMLSHAVSLSQASNNGTDREKIQALDSNLKLWVEIETTLKNAKNLLPQEIKDNLLKLSKFVERLTLSKGINMSKSDYDTLVNINMQISEGLVQAVRNSLAREEAFSLLKCAIDLSSAKENKNATDLVNALDNNMKLWVYIKTLASSDKNELPQATRSNLIKLADYVSKKTIEVGKNIHNVNDKTLDSMIVTNLQISEGLMSNRK